METIAQLRWLPGTLGHSAQVQQAGAQVVATAHSWLQQEQHKYAATVVAIVVPVIIFLYSCFLANTAQGPTPGFKHLAARPAGDGKATWSTEGGNAASATGDGVRWLGERELRCLEAICDTLLPGFVGGKKAIVEETVAVVRTSLFHPSSRTASSETTSSRSTSTSTSTSTSKRTSSLSMSSPKRVQKHPRDLPPALERYTRRVAERCIEMAGRPASDVGVARLLAKAFEVNLPHEQRSGLQLLLWVLNTRLGAFLLTGRAVPFPAQSFAARHALLRRWSRSRVGKLREAFQGVKRLSCSLYFSAHPEVTPASLKHPPATAVGNTSNVFDDSTSSSPSSTTPPSLPASLPPKNNNNTTIAGRTATGAAFPNAEIPSRLPSALSPSRSSSTSSGCSVTSNVPTVTAAAAAVKTNPNWRDIRYDPQHHRLAREAAAEVGLGATTMGSTAKALGLWYGAKEKFVQVAAKAARAASSPTLRPAPVHNPPSPANATSGGGGAWGGGGSSTPNPSHLPSVRPGFFSRSSSTSNIMSQSSASANSNSDHNKYFRASIGVAATTSGGGGVGVYTTSPGRAMPRRAQSYDSNYPRPPSINTSCTPPIGTRTAAVPTAQGNRAQGAAAAAAAAVPSKLVVDVVVVGSGAGGGCAAGALAAQGLKVAVLEKGGLYDDDDFAGFSEMEAYRALYEKQGVLATDDAGVVLLAGSCVGGGTTVNWTASFRTPRHVRVEWARKLGLKSFELDGPFDKALDAVCKRLGVNTQRSHRTPSCQTAPSNLRVSQHNSSLWNGATASGLFPRLVPRNAKGCEDCGSCLHGCASGSKRSTHKTWLQDGIESGNITLLPNTEVDRVLMDDGRATGVLATVTPRGGGKATSLTVLSRAVVVSAGAIHTPAILLRSGLKHPLIGRHLCLHPVLLVGGVFPEDYRQGDSAEGVVDDSGPISKLSLFSSAYKGDGAGAITGKGTRIRTAAASDARYANANSTGRAEGIGAGTLRAATRKGQPRSPDFGRGVMMGVYVQDWMGLDGGYGAVIEAPPMHPGLMGLCMPWNDALSHRLTVAMARETSVFLCIGRDRSSADNRIVLGPQGNAVVKYTLGKEDGQVLVRARSEMLRLMRKAGASLLVPAHEGAPWFCPQDGRAGDEGLEEYIQAVEEMGTTTNQAGVYSAHQMGSCRLSATREGGPLRESGETWECNGLFVADASVFPTSIGINPMITIEAVAYMVAEQVATRLGKENWPAGPGSGADTSPLRRRMKSFGKAVFAAMSRDSHGAHNTTSTPWTTADHEPDIPLGYSSGDGALGASGGRIRTPIRAFSHRGHWGAAHNDGGGKASHAAAAACDDFGVDLSKLAW